MAEVERLPGSAVVARTLRPYVCPLAVEWIASSPDDRYRSVTGTLVFADVSGFTRLTERLASQGKAGAEEITELLDLVLGALLDASTERGGWLVKWGGDALLLMFDGEDHAARACAAAARMRAVIARVGRLDTSVGHIRLKMSVAVNTGDVDYVLAGRRHRELVVTGATATATAQLEGEASAGEILLGHETAASLPTDCLGPGLGSGTLLARAPRTGQPPPAPDGGVARPKDLERAMDPGVAAALLAGAGAGEHRMVAVAFVEFRGVAELGEREGVLAVVDAVDRLVTVTQDAAARFGVTFHETDIGPDGGKILLVAGAPESLDAPEEALLCAVRETLDRFEGLRLRAGVTSGRVFSGGLGPQYRRSYSIKGDVVNLAARIMGKAEPGQILALPEVVAASRTTFSVTPREPFSVKGKKHPVTTVAVGHVRRGPDVDGTDPRELPLCGRTAEVAVFDDALRRAEDGEGGTLIDVVGGPGSGKSRLLAEVAARTGATVFASRGEPYHAATPYGVLGDLVRRALHLDAADGAEVAVQLEAWARTVAPDLAAWLPLLAVAIGTSLPETPETAALDESFRFARLQEVVVAALADALSDPTLLVVDDAQHCDEASLAVLQKVAEVLGTRPWVLVVSHRPWTRGAEILPTKAAVPVREVVVAPLDPADAAALVAHDTHDAPLPRHVCTAILARAGGQPLFLRELVRAARSGSKELPDTVERVLAAGIDRLAPADRLLLRACAVQGLQADLAVTAHLVEAAPSPAAWERLDGYLARDGGSWRFRESLAREVAYEGLPYRQRALLHGRLADLLSASDSEADPAALSEHYFLAGRYESALVHSRAAADAATGRYAFTEAAIAYERALASVRRLRVHDRAMLADLWYELGETRRYLGEYEEAEAAYAASHRLAPDPVAQARSTQRWAQSASWRGAYSLGLRRVRRNLETLQSHAAAWRVDPAVLEEARNDLLLREADLHILQGRHQRAVEGASEVMEHPATTTLRQRALALEMLHLATATLGDERSVRYGEEALAAYRELGDRLAEGRILLRTGAEAFYVGRWTQAVARYAEAEAAYASAGAGDTGTMAVVSMHIAEVLLEQWLLDEAVTRLLDVLRTFRASRAENMAAFVTLLLGRALVRLERFDEGREHLIAARASLAAQGSRAEVVDADAHIAELTSLEGRHGEALTLARSALRRANALAKLPEKASLLNRIIAASHAAAGEWAESEAAYQEALRVARARRANYDVAFTLAALSVHRRRVGLAPDPEWRDEIEGIATDLGLGAHARSGDLMTGRR